MNILYLVVPVALAFVAAAVIAYVMSARSGQFDDLETPAIRILFDDEPAQHEAETAPAAQSGDGRP